MAALIAAQRDEHRVPHAVACRALGVSRSWFYTWKDHALTPRAARREALAAEVRRLFKAHRGTYGSPRITADLIHVVIGRNGCGTRFRSPGAVFAGAPTRSLAAAPAGPEPPRPSDPDPGEPGRAHELADPAAGFVIDPVTATGMAEDVLKVELLEAVYPEGSVPAEVRAYRVRVVREHPAMATARTGPP